MQEKHWGNSRTKLAGNFQIHHPFPTTDELYHRKEERKYRNCKSAFAILPLDAAGTPASYREQQPWFGAWRSHDLGCPNCLPLFIHSEPYLFHLASLHPHKLTAQTQSISISAGPQCTALLHVFLPIPKLTLANTCIYTIYTSYHLLLRCLVFLNQARLKQILIFLCNSEMPSMPQVAHFASAGAK